MPQFKTPDGNSPATFAKIIEKFCPHFAKEEQQKKDDYFADFCKVGALLQDSKVCNQNLAKLNEAMELKYKQKLQQAIATYKMSNANADPVGKKFEDVKTASKGPSGYLPPPKVKPGGGVPVLDADRFKFWGSLNATLSEKETVWGFNENNLKTYGAAPGKIALLTGNVHQEVFRKDLLIAARHWKDPMVPEGHGEFSHRLQWYIVCAEQEHKFGGETYKLQNDGPLLMVATARNIYMLNKTLTGEDRWMWDLLFDSFYNRGADDFNGTKTFRSPEFMMSTYRSMITTGTADLLSLFIRYRLDKRVAMNLNRTDDAGTEAAKEYLKNKLASWGIKEADYAKFAGKDGVAESGRVIFNQKA